MDSVADDGFLCRRVSPFGNLRIDAYVPLPGAYRSLSRPSSAPDAKAFPLCSSSLNLLVLKNYAGSIRFSVCRNCYPFVFPQLLQTFAFCCLACPLLSVQFSMCSPRRRGSRGLRFRGYRKGRESSQALDRSSSSNRNIRFDLRDAGIEGSFPRFSKSKLSEAGLIWKGRRSHRICSFRGAFANRGNGMELASSDAAPSKLNNAENELSSWPDLGFRSALGKPESP